MNRIQATARFQKIDNFANLGNLYVLLIRITYTYKLNYYTYKRDYYR